MYEPKNRSNQSLPILELRVDHAEGSHKTCPNGMVGCAIWAKTGTKPDLNGSGLMAGSEIFNLKALGPVPGLLSDISGGPAVRYRADDLDIALTPDELYRFASHSLAPGEYSALRNRYGMFHEIHEDFYDPDTGAAFQPMFDEEYLEATGIAP